MAMAIIFDTLKFANRLKAAGVQPEIAEAHAEAEAEVFTESLTNQVGANNHSLPTKHDIIKLESRIDNLECKIEEIKNELIIKLGGTIVAVGALLGALLAIFHS